jgi:hypothetical protein
MLRGRGSDASTTLAFADLTLDRMMDKRLYKLPLASETIPFYSQIGNHIHNLPLILSPYSQ